MRKIRLIALITGIPAVIAGVVYLYLSAQVLKEQQCESEGGRWDATQRVCQTMDCVARGDCKPSYRNQAMCRKLTPGLTEAEVMVRLGMPLEKQGGAWLFASGGADAPLMVRFENGSAVTFDCR